MIYDKARELAKLLSNSDEYKAYEKARDKAYENETTKTLLKDYHKLQLEAQATRISGAPDNSETMERMKKLGELLMMNKDAAAFVMAEYTLHNMLGDVYKILGEAIDIDLSELEQ